MHRKDLKAGELKALEEEQRAAMEERELHEKRLADLKTKDHSGLVRQEKELAQELTKKEARCKEEEKALQALRKKHAAGVKEREKMFTQLHDFLKSATVDLAKHRLRPALLGDHPQQRTGLPVPQGEPRSGDRPVAHRRPPSAAPAKRSSASKKKKPSWLRRAASCPKPSRAKSAVSPNWNRLSPSPRRCRNFREARTLLNLHMIEARPLYEGLEWRSGVNRRLKSAVEELIGLEILSTFLVDEDAAPTRPSRRCSSSSPVCA